MYSVLEAIKSIEFNQLIQLISVFIAMVASIAAWRSATITAKLYKLNERNTNIKTQPILKIDAMDFRENNIFIRIENIGFPFIHITDVYASESKDKVALKEHYKNNYKRREQERDGIFIKLYFDRYAVSKFIIYIEGMNISGEKIKFKTNEILINEKGTLANGTEIYNQNLFNELI